MSTAARRRAAGLSLGFRRGPRRVLCRSLDRAGDARSKDVATEAAPRKIPIEAPPGPHVLRRSLVRGQSSEQRRSLTGHPAFGDLASEGFIGHFRRLEYLVDRALCDLSGHPPHPQFIVEAPSTPRSMAKAIPDEGGGHGRIVDEPTLRKALDAARHPVRVETLLAEAPLEFPPRASPVREKGEGGLPHAHVGIERQENISSGRIEVVAYS